MKKILIYYGWLNAFNSAQNGWDNELVSQELSSYDLLVIGDGLQDPAHGDYSNTVAIINRIKEINPDIKIFGYVTLNQDEASFEAKVEQWDSLFIHGIFVDEAGYDFGTVETNGRDSFNDKISFVHSQINAKLVMANAWNPNHILSEVEDPSFPNATYNAGANVSLMNSDDYYLFESFMINTDSYSETDGIGPYPDQKNRVTSFNNAIAVGANVIPVSCGIINDDNENGQSLFNILHSISKIFSMHACGSSSSLYGAPTASSKSWQLPPE